MENEVSNLEKNLFESQKELKKINEQYIVILKEHEKILKEHKKINEQYIVSLKQCGHLLKTNTELKKTNTELKKTNTELKKTNTELLKQNNELSLSSESTQSPKRARPTDATDASVDASVAIEAVRATETVGLPVEPVGASKASLVRNLMDHSFYGCKSTGLNLSGV